MRLFNYAITIFFLITAYFGAYFSIIQQEKEN